MVYDHDLHLVELMKAVQSTYVLSIGTRFSSEAWGIAESLHWKVFFAQDNIAEEVGDRHLCRGNHVEVINLHVVHLTFLVRKLTCAVSRRFIDHQGWHDLHIPCFLSLIQEESDQCTLDLCSFTCIHWEARSSDLHSQLEVYKAIFRGQFPVWNGFIMKLRNLSFLEVDLIILRRLTFWYGGMRRIWQGVQQVTNAVLHAVHLLLQGLNAFFELHWPGLHGFSLFALSLLEKFTDLLSDGVGFIQQDIGLRLDLFPTVVQG